MATVRKYRFEVVTQRADGGERRVVSRHHVKRQAVRRIIRHPLQLGECIAVLEDGKVIHASRCVGLEHLAEIPF